MELLQRFARGDLEAFETLFRQFQARVYGWIVRVVRDRGAAEELTVETFWRIYRARARFDPQRGFEGWARRIATNVALDHLKTCCRDVALPEELKAERQPDPAVQSELRERINRAFLQLPAQYQLTATLALIEDRPYAEIAEALGISVTAVKLRVFRAVRLLRKNLERLGVKP